MDCIDLFSGAGGFTTGAEAAGARVLFAVNHWAPAVATHRANHPHVIHAEQDLMEYDWTAAPPVDCVLASPACQDFSECGQPAKAGSGGSHPPDVERMARKRQRDRNTTWAVLACADSVRPETLIVENVPKLLRWDLFSAWRHVLESMGYAVQIHSINAADYGSPQDRTRVIITARQGRALDLAPRIDAPRLSIGDCLDSDDDPANRWRPIDAQSERMVWRMRKAQGEGGARCFWNNVSESRGRPLDDLFPTATTQSATQFQLLDGDRCRVLNTSEMARVQSFPESHVWPANKKIAGKLIGNAIDCKLSRGIVAQAMAA